MNKSICKSFEILDSISVTNKYNYRNWNTEVSTKYIVRFEGNIVVELSYFSHYKDKVHVKNAIEIPLSSGCSIKCRHCASGHILRPVLLDILQLIKLFDFIVEKHQINEGEYFNISYTGMGESMFQLNNLIELSKYIYNRFLKSEFVFSTVGFSGSYIKRIDALSTLINIRYLHITYLHYDADKVSLIIPYSHDYGFDILKLVEIIKNLNNVVIRINFVVIKGYNDDLEHLGGFINIMKSIKNKVIVRISRLNETDVSNENELFSPSLSRVVEIKNNLLLAGFNCYIFSSETNDKMNCGQLMWKYC